MNRWLGRSLLGAAVLAALAAAGLGAGVALGQRKAERRVALPPEAIVAVPDPADAATLARGRYLFASRGCASCHGADGAGRTVIDAPNGLRVDAPDITRGPGSAAARYGVADWQRTIRHGVKPDGRPAAVMPSEDYNQLSTADLAAVVAYARQLPPAAAGRAAVVRLPALVKALYGAGLVQDAAEKIDHARPMPQPVPEGTTAAHGAYVANACVGCHGAGLSGGRIPGAPPDWPAASNLTPGEGSVLPRYADAAALAAMFATGRRPDGSAVKVMPFDMLREMSAVDVQALHLHLRGLPPRPAGER